MTIYTKKPRYVVYSVTNFYILAILLACFVPIVVYAFFILCLCFLYLFLLFVIFSDVESIGGSC